MQIFPPPAYIVPKLEKPMDATTHFLEKIQAIYPLTDTEINALKSHICLKSYPKNHFLLNQNEVSDTLYFIVSGLVRAFYNDQKTQEEITAWFLPEGGFIYSVTSFVDNTPSFEAIVAEEDTLVVAITKHDLEQLFLSSGAFTRIALYLTEQYLCIYDERVRSLRLPATECYERFQSQYPQLEARVKLNHLASYLGIARSTLFDLRKKRNTRNK